MCPFRCLWPGVCASSSEQVLGVLFGCHPVGDDYKLEDKEDQGEDKTSPMHFNFQISLHIFNIFQFFVFSASTNAEKNKRISLPGTYENKRQPICFVCLWTGRNKSCRFQLYASKDVSSVGACAR